MDAPRLGPPLEFTLGPRERADPGAGDDTGGAPMAGLNPAMDTYRLL
jgi:hypothetical protein